MEHGRYRFPDQLGGKGDWERKPLNPPACRNQAARAAISGRMTECATMHRLLLSGGGLPGEDRELGGGGSEEAGPRPEGA